MDEKYLEALVSSEKEWRRYMVQEITAIRYAVGRTGNRLTRVETTQKWVWTILGAPILALVFWVIKKEL